MQRYISIFILLTTLFVVGCAQAVDPALPASPTGTAASVVTAATVVPTPLPPTATVVIVPTTEPTSTAPASPTELPFPTSTPVSTTTPAPLVFAAIGDYGEAGPALEAVVTQIKSWNPDFIITLGDNNYPNGSAETIDANIGQYFAEFIHPYSGTYGPGGDANRFFPTLGNHDWTNGIQPYLDYFTLPGNERYYDFERGPVHFFALDGDSREPDGVSVDSVQAAWLKEQLAASTAQWKVVYSHFPAYTSDLRGSVTWMRWPYFEWGADIVLAGHNHVYERVVREEGVYLINGLGGGGARYLFPPAVEGSEVRYRNDFGALRGTATDETLTFEFITRDGTLIDSYTLTKDAAPIPETVTVFPDVTRAEWQPLPTQFRQPLLITHAGDGTGQLYVVEQPGVIRLEDGSIFLDISERVGTQGNEQGLLGLAFHPAYETNGRFYVNYTDNSGTTRISMFQRSLDPAQADPNSEALLVTIPQPYANHNGGHLTFGPDGYLYVAVGDGGAAGDPEDNAQNLGNPLGTLLRLDVDAAPTYVPADNPFIDQGSPLIWAYGLRNPWRFAFDRLTGDLYIGDVGQNQWEEINFVLAGDGAGANFGWDLLEASYPYEGMPNPSLTAPVWEYDHGQGCSVTGGVVYRGTALPEWSGVYLFGDFCYGTVWGLLRDANGEWQHQTLFQTDALITSFGEDEQGEIYLIDRGGTISKLVQIPQE